MKIHELLAIDGQLKGQAQATRTDLTKTFKDKRAHFEEKVLTFLSNEEGAKAITETRSDLQTTILKELKWLSGILSKQYDISYQVAEANMSARGDVVLDNGIVLFRGAPTTALMELDHRLGEILELVGAIPTLDPVKGFSPDTQRGENIFKAREVVRARTKKTQRVITLAPATPEHPAQAQIVSEDVIIGQVTENEWSGLISVSQKGDMIERVEELRRAVKTARMRANDTELMTKPTVGAAIFAYVIDGTQPKS